MKKLSLVIFSIQVIWTSSLCAQAGKLDMEFGGGDGLVATSFFSQQPAEGFAIAVHPDGRIMVSGYTRAADDIEYATLACYQSNGTLDHSFNGTGKLVLPASGVYAYSQALAIQPDGKVIVVAVQYDSQETWIALYRYNADGSPDITFDDDGRLTTKFGVAYASANAIACQPDGKILVGGYIGNANEDFDRFYVARYLPDGGLDRSFDEDGIAITAVGDGYTGIASVLVQPDGKIIAAGYAEFDQQEAFAVVRYYSDGTLDYSFGDDGIASAFLGTGYNRGKDAALQSDGKLVIGGYSYNSVTGEAAFAAIRFNRDGTPDASFDGDGMVKVAISGYSDGARTMLLQPDGKILLGGYVHSDINGGPDMAMVRLTQNGIPDITFSGDGMIVYADGESISSEIYDMAFQPDGKIVATGYARTDGLNSVRVARFISGLTVGTSDLAIPDIDISVYPNPVVDDVVIAYQLTEMQTIAIRLCDSQGRVVQELMSPSMRYPRNYAEQLRLKDNMPPGIYFINVYTGERMKSIRILVE